MGRLKQGLLLIRLIEELRDRQTHCTEPRLQACVFFLQEAAGVPLALGYMLYKRRAFSFDLTYALTALRADGLITLDPHRNGPRFLPTRDVNRFQRLYPITLSKYNKAIGAVVKELADKPIRDLQAVAAALFIARKTSEAPEERDQRLDALGLCVPPLEPETAIGEATRLAKALQQASETSSAPSP
jgi:hypothetical protein